MNNSSRTKPSLGEYYDSETDVKWLVLKKGEEDKYYEIAPGVNVEFNKSGEMIGLEIFDYSKRFVENYGFKSEVEDVDFSLPPTGGILTKQVSSPGIVAL